MMSAKKTKAKNDLVPQKAGTLSNRSTTLSIGALERALLSKFPASDAETWDHTGILVGDPLVSVKGVALALDATVQAIHEAHAIGANVLLTHHPVYREAPSSFSPKKSAALNPGAGVWAAIESGIALMCFHTALDVSKEASSILPGMLHVKFEGIADPIDQKGTKGYGQICRVRSEDDPLSLGQLAARCTSVFGRHPRVWGDFEKNISRMVTCTGSVGDLATKCLASHIDVLICGEIRYHDALAASQAGLAIIDLGHDTSELPLVAVLARAAESAGVPQERITILDQGFNWNSPESTRV